MIDHEKIRLMTRAAAFEEREKRGAFKINEYFCSDYVSREMLRAAIGITVGYLLAVGVWALIHFEELLTKTQIEGLILIGERLLFLYVIVLLAVLGIAAVVALHKYRRMEKQMKQYVNLLKMIDKMDSEDTTPTEGK